MRAVLVIEWFALMPYGHRGLRFLLTISFHRSVSCASGAAAPVRVSDDSIAQCVVHVKYQFAHFAI